MDDRAALAVGFRGVTLDASEPGGVIVSTRDGGDSWASTLDRAFLWKTSVVGARR